MKTLHDYIRDGILRRTGVVKKPLLPSWEILRESEWCHEFEHLMRNRLIMGAFRYGRNFENRPQDKPQYNRVGRIKTCCEQYLQTGNLELLVDIANMAMLEYGEGNHPLKHFHASDDCEHAQAI